MIDKLTLQDCFKYPNAKITSLTGITIFANVRILIEYAYKSGLSVLNVLDSFKLKLILRDISELTDEEKEYAEYNYFFEECGDWANICEVFKCALGTFDGNNSVELADYLRSINVDIDGFFKCGKAVKE